MTESKKEESLSLPQGLENITTRKSKYKDRQFFSPAIFKEDLKSNWVGWLLAGLGNSFILIIIIMILSTLNINGTKSALTELFSNANMETTLKQGAVGLYASFDECGKAFLEIETSQEQLVSLSSEAYVEINGDNAKSSLESVDSGYDVIFALFKDHSKAKAMLVENADTYMEGYGLTEDQKELAKKVLPYYLDSYYKKAYVDNKKAYSDVSVRDIAVDAIPQAVKGILPDYYEVSLENAEKAGKVVKDSFVEFNSKYDALQNKDSQEVEALAYDVAYDNSFDLIGYVGGEDAKTVTDSLKEAYQKTDSTENDYKSMYQNDTDSYRSRTMSEAIQDMAIKSFADYAYYIYLPSFAVNCVTDDLGYPIRYINTGKVDSAGNSLLEEVRILTYDPDSFIQIKGEMGAMSNLVQKMRKVILTGEDYTEAEYEAAKEEASQNIEEEMKPRLADFMDEFIVRDENGDNKFITNGVINETAIADKVNELVVDMAEDELLDNYNSSNGTNFSSIYQISAENNSMSGQTLMDTVRSYSSAGVASFRSIYADKIENGYVKTDALLSALVKSSTGVIDSLPTKVSDSLSDMGKMNIYGMFVGVVAFGIASTLIPMVYTIILANSLVAERIETGSLAFTLSTPTKRSTFIHTQALFLVTTETVLAVLLFLGGLVSRELGIAFGGSDLIESLSISNLCQYALGNFMITLAISGICFLSSSYFNKTRYSIAVGGSINIMFFIFTILGLFGSEVMPGTIRIEGMYFFNYLTIHSLYDGSAVMNGDPIYWAKLSALLVITAITYFCGMLVFDKKDLPL